MKKSLFHITGIILCLTSGVLISVIEVQFFSDSPHLTVIFAGVLLVTVLIVYVYFTAGNNAIFLLLYTTVLSFLLDFLGKNVDIRALLACLFCLGLLYAQSHFQANSERFCTSNPAFGSYFIILLICFGIVMCSTFVIYRSVLEPLLPESEKFALFQEVEEEVPQVSPQWEEQNESAGAPDENEPGGGQGGEPQPFPWKLLLLGAGIVFAAAACGGICWIVTGCIRYQIRRRRILAAPARQQAAEIYRYCLRALAAYGCPRQIQETPFEYLRVCKQEDFPLSAEQFETVSRVFVASSLGQKSVSQADSQTCLLLFRSISRSFKKRMGLRRYVFRYLTRMHLAPSRRWT